MFVYRYFYRHEITPVYDKDRILEPRIIAILGAREIDSGPTLRSGSTHRIKQVQYLCSIEGVPKKKYLDKAELLKYINGEEKLKNFEAS